MSRSYKKYPLLRIDKKKDFGYLNKSLRREKLVELPNGSYFKKYKSHEGLWCYRWTEKEAIEEYYTSKYIRYDFPTLEDYLNYWKSLTIRK